VLVTSSTANRHSPNNNNNILQLILT